MLGSYPAPRKTAIESSRDLLHFVGPDRKVGLLCTDGSGELESAANTLAYPHGVATPHRPRTNGVAERAVRRVKEGTRCLLHASGLDHEWWAEAMTAYCALRNLADTVETIPHRMSLGTAHSCRVSYYLSAVVSAASPQPLATRVQAFKIPSLRPRKRMQQKHPPSPRGPRLRERLFVFENRHHTWPH